MFKKNSKGRCVLVIKARGWKRMPMKLLKWGRKMPSTKQYNLVPNDEYDTRIPLHPDEAFKYGIKFQAKYIGTMDVPRPSSRVEIVAAMRRVRVSCIFRPGHPNLRVQHICVDYEFKAKGVKKRKVTIEVSTDGVRVSTRKKPKPKTKKGTKFFSRSSKSSEASIENIDIMHHPIYRIFYVSHDSSDLKIFSYIARDGATNLFKCNVFKSNRKSQAMRIVRTVGQAFEVCHKMQINTPEQAAASTSSAADDLAFSDRAPSDQPATKEAVSDCGASEVSASSISKVVVEVVAEEKEKARPTHLELLPPPPRKVDRRTPQLQQAPPPVINLPGYAVVPEAARGEAGGDPDMPLSTQHQVQLLEERLENQTQQTRAAVAQLFLLRDQLAAEQSARCEAQARTHQLLVHNKELLEHIAALVAHLQERERGSTKPIKAEHLTLLPQKGGEKQAERACNGNPGSGQPDVDSLIDLITHTKLSQNVENNNPSAAVISQFSSPGSPPSFGNMTNEQIQNYLCSKFQNISTNGTDNSPVDNLLTLKHSPFYQNRNAFPNVPPVADYSHADLANLLGLEPHKIENNLEQAMSVGQSDNSLYSASQVTTSKDSTPDAFSSDDGAPFIMPLSHNGTLTATSEDGRVRLIVPVSPSGSTSDVPEGRAEPSPHGATLAVPEASVAYAAPITRSTSEKVPNHSQMMTALRQQWTRHTTK